MKLIRMSFKKIMEVNKSLKLDEKASADRILLEKERNGISYTDIARKINKTDSSFRRNEPFSVGNRIKKMLHAKRPDSALTIELSKILNLPEMDLRQRIATIYYYKVSDAKSQRGCISKAKTEECKAQYDDSIKYANCSDDNYDETTIEEAIYNTFEYGETYDEANEKAGLEFE